MSGSNIILYAIIGFCFGIFIFIAGFKWMKIRNLVMNTPTSKVRSVPIGLVELYGKAIPQKDKRFRSPILDEECVYYNSVIRERRGGGKKSRWVTIFSDEVREMFYLRDDTGTVLIDPKDAEIDIPADLDATSGIGKDPPSEVISLLKLKGISYEGLLGMNKQMKFTEYVIKTDDQVYVLGTAKKNPFVKSSSKNEDLVMIQKGENDKVYYISDTQEKKVLDKLRWKILGGFFGGIALSAGCLAVILIYFGVF
jgi:hypothetical protein